MTARALAGVAPVGATQHSGFASEAESFTVESGGALVQDAQLAVRGAWQRF